ncbi:MAG: BlaI/MecI/CopY family transcriptional regulator [Armatimonadetes bacterium]|nr:BlaI/MecI/CopY family transcriptional regulator [Armatimonadota bacterium]MDW8029920.1 BlaI/MecI/CopY family transcriptional regulator [Armatimonadota bacterium]
MLSPLEAEIMRIVWDKKSATVREVWQELRSQGKRLAYTTVMTVMVRLYEKGILRRVKEGKGYRYFPNQPCETMLKRFVDSIVDRIVAVFGEPAISYLAEVVRKRR